tara:strand:+ start:281 stop:1069 length:789 start_codon:yes stop_codon:yes gene_type:complete
MPDPDAKERRFRSKGRLAWRGQKWRKKYTPEERAAMIVRQAKDAALAKARAANKRLCGEVASANGELWSAKQAHARRLPRQRALAHVHDSVLDMRARTCQRDVFAPRVLVQKALQESYDADYNLRIANERAAANKRKFKSQVVCTERANQQVYAADRVTQRASYSTFQHAGFVQEQASVLCSAAEAASQEVMAAAKSLPPSKRTSLEQPGGALSTLTTAVEGLKERQKAVGGKLAASSQEVRAANSAACLAQHGAYASIGRQ